MATARELIEGSMRLIGAIATGETASSEEATTALTVLNEMLDSWSTESLVIYDITREEFTLTPGTGAYTIGTSGAFNTPRPLKIENAAIEIQSASPTTEMPLKLLSPDEWAAIATKDIASSIPTELFMDGAYPLATINLWPKPTAAEKLVIYSWKPLTAIAELGTSISLPPGYSKAVRYNLALELAPEYGRDPSTIVVANAAESKANIKRMNSKPVYLECDIGLLGRRTYNIMTGE